MLGSPKVWSKFSAKKKDGTSINLRIVEAPETIFQDVLALYVKYFVNEETTFKAADLFCVKGVPYSLEAMQELQGPLLQAAGEEGLHVVVCCVDNGDDQVKDVIGASVMAIISKNDPKPKYDFKTIEMQQLWKIVAVLETYYDEKKEFDLERRFTDKGIFVCPAYRGFGIAQEFLKVRRLICKEYGIPINGAWMTSYGTQKAAERDGWETVCEVKYEELAKKIGITVNSEFPSSKFMIARIQ